MTAYDWAVVIAIGALLILASSYRPRSQRRFQATARAAARAPRTAAEVQRDLDAAKADRQQVQAALDLGECLAIWNATTHNIPHQTRRTEDNQ
ncbi:hypothetical protein ACIGO7_35595 [Streptomyces virginiae]|uniref:hypothetical protein n=1 Tax=Streptomyces virginiae TaxID=1961 RepID=UPI00344DC3B1